MQLREYQSEVIKDLYEQIRKGHKRVLIAAPTGSGKTVIGSQIIADARKKRKKVLFIVHLDVLVGQTYSKLAQFGIDWECAFIKAGYKEKPDYPIQIASIQTLNKRKWWKDIQWDVIIYDEAHQTVFSQVGKKIGQLYPDSYHIGLTATPYRLSKTEGMADHFTELVQTPPPAVLQELGHLSQMEYYGIDSFDLSEVGTSAGDYKTSDLSVACDRPELIESIIREWRRLAEGKRTLAFCIDINHAEHVANAFRNAGIPSAVVSGKTPISERQKLYGALKHKEIQVLTSCNVVSIGFDEPSVECGLLLRPTKSKAMHHQQIGRVMRISPATGKTKGIILDQAGNVTRLGFPEDIKKYTLDAGKEKGDGDAPTKICPQCNLVVYAFVKQCECGHVFERIKPQFVPSNLVRLDGQNQERLLVRKHLRRALKDGKFQQIDYNYGRKYGGNPTEDMYLGLLYSSRPSADECYDYYRKLMEVSQEFKLGFRMIKKYWIREFGIQNEEMFEWCEERYRLDNSEQLSIANG